MKKFLYLARYYPPISSIASMRSWKLAKYIGDFGWEPIVIAGKEGDPEWNSPLPDVSVYRVLSENSLSFLIKKMKNKKIITKEVDVSNVEKSFFFRTRIIVESWLKEIIFYPEACNQWRKNAYVCGKEIMVKEKPVAIISTACPFSSHLIADKLSKEFDVPWIADYRDLWTGSHLSDHTVLRRFFDEQLEKKTLRSASGVVTVSKPLADTLGKLLGRYVHVVSNGFDQEDYSNCSLSHAPCSKSGDKEIFSIVYTGSLYSGKLDPSPLFKAIRLLLKNKKIEGCNLKVRFIGPGVDCLEKNKIDSNIESIISFEDRISPDEIVKVQVNASVLLFLSWPDKSQKGLYSGKLFEYLGARRPILAMTKNPGSVVDQLIMETNSGVICSEPEEIANVIKQWYDEYYQFGKVAYHGKEEEIMKYDRKNQAKQFAELLDSVFLKSSLPIEIG